MHRRITQATTAVMMLALLITGCTSQASNIGVAKDKENNVVDTGFTVSTVGSYDSADTAVVMSTDEQNKSVTFLNMGTGRQYTLYYDGTTYVKDKYDGPMTISQIRAGDVVDVNFLKGKRQIASIQISPQAWVYDNIGNYDLGGVNKTASIGSATYSLPDDVVVLSEGKRTEVMDIVAQDVVSIRGIDHKIYSINVEKGHGYLRLKNDQMLIGGWIEVGNTVIREITEDMLLVVPEGSYQVFLSNEGASCSKDVVIERDKEVVLDVGDLEVAQDKTGRILLSVTPENAKVTIDGKSVDISSAIELPYGIHQVHLEAGGYESLTKYIQVGSEYAKISFTMEEEKEEDTSSISYNSIEENPVKEEESPEEDAISATKTNKVYIDSPKNVEVYLDSNYVGMSPVSFKKVVGSHTITLRKSGYKTKSYTIYLYNDGEDITYSFTDLEKEKNTVSGNKNNSSTTSSKPVDHEVDQTVSDNNLNDLFDPFPGIGDDDEEEGDGGNSDTKNPGGGKPGDGSNGSGTEPPGTDNPEGGNLGDENNGSDTQEPGTDNPDVEKPGDGNNGSGTQPPDTDNPDSGNLGDGNNGSGTQEPGTENSGNQNSGTESAGSKEDNSQNTNKTGSDEQESGEHKTGEQSKQNVYIRRTSANNRSASRR